ncbi:MAG: glutamine-hydrolyzing carbamoyl-phosphate synthase small subunit [Candidatus Marinimicrobia bacterium]|jgi:carbamoyl-phosphate synthase small subunit|nr:glutamine-hydrolyzing carbamoyl-phosphate synthase small subunit [Gammaproteobacteria bacterium]MBT3727905.1 glutamine-hydrolyzing carbamoyl-phosphate synthase small subunit [Candidatus Neomarinimicrobiota bacterium]MBT3943908.1 glutamine-hydrolyzing carbamoyl-phosphate synthase small subunit [Candidatus Neomarinimicrobiota bacterium]MBT4111896.1 glutamine-hydrolyzing carbamoyl-phosphate synthase small subunit [Candidatus Neomarinimicrobiota bacterium]MBT4316809.1 glutamine-hydrolyzing carba
MRKQQKAILYLEDGLFFKGKNLGALGETSGEVCFNTGMTGYQEILTDPSYAKQMIVMCSPHIGNYGTNSSDIESPNVYATGLIIKSESLSPSNWRSSESLDKFLKSNKVVGIQDIDTRALTIHIRSNGSMKGIISTKDFDIDSLAKKIKKIPSMEGLDLAKEVSRKEKTILSNVKNPKYKIAAIDYGMKSNIYDILLDKNSEVVIFPASVSAQEVLDYNPDGVFLSNGPGDPAAVSYGIETVKQLLGIKPIFGICLGHQILALALEAQTFKMKFGHRGINQPVKNLNTNKIEITSQNHGFAVSEDSLASNITITHTHLNDNTVAGIACEEMQAYSVQYHPEASPGPHDSRYVFDNFFKMMDSNA